MYVNTLITLQENLATYAVDGKKISGHVTMNSPGMIKCYIQNLKVGSRECKYALYAFSKKKDKGARIGELSGQKETKWMVDEKNIQGSSLRLDELDAVAIVAENNMRGADTIAMGFSSNKYMIIPLIDAIIKKTPVQKENKILEPKVESKTQTTNKNIVKPDPIPEGKSPIAKNIETNKTSSQLNLKESPQSGNTGPSGSWSNSSGTTMNQGTQSNNTGANTNGNNPSGTMMNQETQSSNTGNSGNWNTMNPSNMDTQNENNDTDPFEPWDESMAVQEDSVNSVGGTNTNSMGESLESGNIQKNLILEGQFENKNNQFNESLEDGDAELIKIAEKLQEIENAPSVQKTVKSGIPYTSSSSASNATVVRDTEDENVQKITEQTSEELKRIINKLKADSEIRNKISDIEKQLEQMNEGMQTREASDKSMIQKTLEARYLSKQDGTVEEVNQSNYEEAETFIEEEQTDKIWDTTPKKALEFIYECLKDETFEIDNKSEYPKKAFMNKERAEYSSSSIQEEIDYIKEIDKKIKEIENRRKQEKK